MSEQQTATRRPLPPRLSTHPMTPMPPTAKQTPHGGLPSSTVTARSSNPSNRPPKGRAPIMNTRLGQAGRQVEASSPLQAHSEPRCLSVVSAAKYNVTPPDILSLFGSRVGQIKCHWTFDDIPMLRIAIAKLMIA